MSDKELNFRDLFENSKAEGGCGAPASAEDKKHRQPSQYAHYNIETINNLRIDKPIEQFHKKSGVNGASLRQFKKNCDHIKSRLDLHGCTRTESIEMLAKHIERCKNEGILYFLVIFGKGLSSPGEPVLKKVICAYLVACPEVLAYEFAKPKDGGSGAAYVMLRR